MTQIESRQPQSPWQQLLLRTFEIPRRLNQHPGLTIAEWTQLLNQHPDEVAAHLQQANFITPIDPVQALAEQYGRAVLRTHTKMHKLPLGKSTLEMARQLLNVPPDQLKQKLQVPNMMQLTAQGRTLLDNAPLNLLATALVKQPGKEAVTRKLLHFFTQAWTGHTVGQRWSTLKSWMQTQLGHLQLPAIKAYINPPRVPTDAKAFTWCYVPPGPFYFGTDHPEKGYDDMPLTAMTIDYGYWVARFPVTVGNYRQFVEESDYGWIWWDWQSDDSHPVRHVLWKHCQAFCDWLNQELQNQIPEGYQISLPNEAEWTKAARGGLQIPETPLLHEGEMPITQPPITLIENPIPDRHQPWGNDPIWGRANTNGQFESTTEVDRFPAGQSPYGIFDMAGNVYERSRSPWMQEYSLEREQSIENATAYTTCSDAWYFIGEHSRCGSRWVFSWHGGHEKCGFRLVLTPKRG